MLHAVGKIDPCTCVVPCSLVCPTTNRLYGAFIVVLMPMLQVITPFTSNTSKVGFMGSPFTSNVLSDASVERTVPFRSIVLPRKISLNLRFADPMSDTLHCVGRIVPPITLKLLADAVP